MKFTTIRAITGFVWVTEQRVIIRYTVFSVQGQLLEGTFHTRFLSWDNCFINWYGIVDRLSSGLYSALYSAFHLSAPSVLPSSHYVVFAVYSVLTIFSSFFYWYPTLSLSLLSSKHLIIISRSFQEILLVFFKSTFRTSSVDKRLWW